MIRAPYLEIVAWFEMMFVLLCFQFSRELIPFFSTKIKVTATLYGEVDIMDYNFSFLWKVALSALPQGI